MKEEEFDNLIKTKVDTIDNLIDVDFDEDAIWKKVSAKTSKKTNLRLYLIVSIFVIILTSIIYFFLFKPNNSLLNKKEKTSPVIKKKTVIIDTIVNKESSVIKNTKNTPLKKELAVENNQRIITNDTVTILKELNQKPIDTNRIHELSKISSQNKSDKLDFEKVMETRAYVHVYRRGKIIGLLNYFTLKANGRKIGTISNGEYEVFMVESGLTEFEIKRKKIRIPLKPRKNYYLRTELILFGKTKFEWVTESFAKKELNSKK